jgi:hypothetical protein
MERVTLTLSVIHNPRRFTVAKTMFGNEVVSKRSMSAITWESQEQAESLRKFCKANGWSVSWVVREAVREFMKKHGAKLAK